MTSPGYVLDTNVFIEAAQRYYAFDIAPVFWRALVELSDDDRAVSIDRVYDEIERGKDELTQWARESYRKAFVSTHDPNVVGAYRQIMVAAQAWVRFKPAAKAEFAQAENADAWVVAFALASGRVVVTHEQYDPNIQRRIPIPNVCREFGVATVDTFQMLRASGVKFL